MFIRICSGESPLVQIRRTGFPAVIAALSLVAAYSRGIYAIQATSVANAMLLFATAPFMAAVLGWIVLREPVRPATWVAITVAIASIATMVADKSGGVALKDSLAALGSAFGFAVFTVALRWGKTGEMLPSVFLSGLFGIIVTSGICLFFGIAPGAVSPGWWHCNGHGGVSGRRWVDPVYTGLSQPSRCGTCAVVTG